MKPPNDGFEFNVISGNGGPGILIEDPGTTGNVVEGNVIGTNSAGFNSLPNAGSGVLIQNNASGNVIGGLSFVSSNFFLGYPLVSGAGNLISGNGGAGVEIFEAIKKHFETIAKATVGRKPPNQPFPRW